MASAAVLRLGPADIRFFIDGWGPEEFLTPIDIAGTPPSAIDITWLTSAVDGDLRVTHGTFTSPFEGLPARARLGSAVSVMPRKEPRRIVVLMPAWNEHEPRVRTALARRLAASGIGSIILENAYFGSRHPDPHGGHPIRTVADFMLMGGSVCVEARGIIAALAADGHAVGVAGYSMGANTAAIVAATMPFAVATAALAASHSPAPVFLDGVLRHGIAWDALGGRAQADRLRGVLSRVSVLDIPPAPHTAHAVVVGARSDAYIPSEATAALADHWEGSELRWEPGGHATLVWLRKDRLAKAVVDAFDRAERAGGP